MCARDIGLTICVLFWCVMQTKCTQRPICSKSVSDRCVEGHVTTDSNFSETIFVVDGNEVIMFMSTIDNTFSISCPDYMGLDNTALPSLSTETCFTEVKIYNCIPPKRMTYGEALLKMNVTVLDKLDINLIITDNVVTKEHLVDFKGTCINFHNLTLADDGLQSSPNLTKLLFEDMKPLPFKFLPKDVHSLIIVNPGTMDLQSEDFTNLSSPLFLSIRSKSDTLTVKAGAPLQNLTLSGNLVFLNAELVTTLMKVKLIGWGETEPLPWNSCYLVNLYIRGAQARTLPDNWLRNCSQLRELCLLKVSKLTSIEADAFRGASALRKVIINGSQLQSLPAQLLYDAENLEDLDLAANNLHSLAGDFFVNSKLLLVVTLSNNKFTNDVIGSISKAASLKSLHIDNNVNFGTNICDVFPDNALRLLEEFSLHNTNTDQICRQWRKDLPALNKLNLSANKIINLRYADLQFGSYATVDLTGNNVMHLQYLDTEYESISKDNCVQKSDTPPVTASLAKSITLSSTLQCGCHEAWAALALRRCPEHISLKNAQCANKLELSKVPFEDLACPVEKKYCPSECYCDEILRESDTLTRVIRVTCENANLTNVPKLDWPDDVAWKLYLAHNNISTPNIKDLPSNLLELDLRHNRITKVDVVTSLLSSTRRVYFSGNLLDCACGTELALAMLHGQSDLVLDFDNITCSDGAKLKVTADCWLDVALISVGVTLIIVLVALPVGCYAHPTSRTWIKTILRGLGCLLHPQEPEERPYEVFLSFSHLDEEIVCRVLRWLEAGPKPYRTIVHSRDWPPGVPIPAYIEASVRLSQRTLVFLSRNFLDSTWAPVEFQQAYSAAMIDHQPRLVVILLEDISKLPLGKPQCALLKRYLKSNTYVCWNDMLFWPKLRAALPLPRGVISHQTTRTTCWTKLRRVVSPFFGSIETESEVDPSSLRMLQQPQRTAAAVAVAEMMAESHRDGNPEAKVIVKAVLEGMGQNNTGKIHKIARKWQVE